MGEPRENIVSMPHAMWLVIVTLSTVGYGDVYPTTDWGRFVTALVVLMGVFYMAMPLTIVGQAFNVTWRNRGRIILINQMRMRLNQWGFTEQDMKIMFRKFDEDHSGELDIGEFSKMVSMIRLDER